MPWYDSCFTFFMENLFVENFGGITPLKSHFRVQHPRDTTKKEKLPNRKVVFVKCPPFFCFRFSCLFIYICLKIKQLWSGVVKVLVRSSGDQQNNWRHRPKNNNEKKGANPHGPATWSAQKANDDDVTFAESSANMVWFFGLGSPKKFKTWKTYFLSPFNVFVFCFDFY